MDGSDGMVDAHKLFDRMPERGVCNATDDVDTWNMWAPLFLQK